MVKVIVCGGRRYGDARRIAEVLAAVKPDVVVTGAYQGADRLAEAWARNNGVPYRGYPANWARHGFSAGPLRNRQMLQAERDGLAFVIAFPGGAGTADCVHEARRLGIEVREVQ